jgi:hypothetical protein
LQDIINGRLDNSGPPREAQRSGLRLITEEGAAGLIEGGQLRDPVLNDYPWVLTRVVIMKEPVLDFAQRHELPLPSWWVDTAGKPSVVPSDANANIVKPNAAAIVSPLVGKQPRIAEHLREHFPNAVPEPGIYPRKRLKAEILEWDSSLDPLDEATLKKAIDTHNSNYSKRKLDPK